MKGGIVYGKLYSGDYYSVRVGERVNFSTSSIGFAVINYTQLKDVWGKYDKDRYSSYRQNLVVPDELL